MDRIELEKLKRIAKKARPGSWIRIGDRGIGAEDTYGIALGMPAPIAVVEPYHEHIAEYIAAACPDVVLSLIAELEKLKRGK